jgi:hypothetical protein
MAIAKYPRLWPLLLVAGMTACAAPASFVGPNCERYRMFGYNVLACDDATVGRHCRKLCPKTDLGNPVDFAPRACWKKTGWGRKDTIFIGKSHMNCVLHEIAHHEHPDDPRFVAEKYPCVGERGP